MDKIISVIGCSYLQPISVLLEKLFSQDSQFDDVSAGIHENSYAVPVTLLSILCFESYAIRTRYLNPNKTEFRSAYKFIKQIYHDFTDEVKLIELYVIRDSIVHNNLWHIDLKWPNINSNETSRSLIHADIDENSGDCKLDKCVNKINWKTKILGLNVIPTHINRFDACKTIRVVVDTLSFLEKKDINICQISNSQVIFKDKRTRFIDLISDLEQVLPTNV